MPRCCGVVRPGYEARVVDENDQPVSPGTPGELIVRASTPWVLNAGYLNNPEASLAAWRNGWFHTGDAFLQDAAGNFYFLDRMKDCIRRRGENISSFEVETFIDAHPEDLVQWLIPRAPRFMIPRYVAFTDALPLTPTQKVRKAVLREAGLADAWDREAEGIELPR